MRDRFFVDMAPGTAPDPHLLGDFVVSGEAYRLAELADIYGVKVDPEQAQLTLPIISTCISIVREGRRNATARLHRAGGAQHQRRQGQCCRSSPA